VSLIEGGGNKKWGAHVGQFSIEGGVQAGKFSAEEGANRRGFAYLQIFNRKGVLNFLRALLSSAK